VKRKNGHRGWEVYDAFPLKQHAMALAIQLEEASPWAYEVEARVLDKGPTGGGEGGRLRYEVWIRPKPAKNPRVRQNPGQLIMSSPAKLEAEKIAGWIRDRGVSPIWVSPRGREWGVFAPGPIAQEAQAAFSEVIRRNPCRNPRCSNPQHRHGRAHPNPANLGEAAAQIAMRAALQYLRAHGLEADPAALAETLRSWVKIKFPEALADVRKALEARMDKVAEQTFAASMALAGIEAAKEAGFPRKNPLTREESRELLEPARRAYKDALRIGGAPRGTTNPATPQTRPNPLLQTVMLGVGNPLTRHEAARALRQSRGWSDHAAARSDRFGKWIYSGLAMGMGSAVKMFGPASADRPARLAVRRAERASGVRNPASPAARRYISAQIRRFVQKGYGQAQAIAAGHAMAHRAGYKVPPPPNPLTRREAAGEIRRIRTEGRTSAELHRRGLHEFGAYRRGYAGGIQSVVVRHGPRKAKDLATRAFLASERRNPPRHIPWRDGQRIPVEKARTWIVSTGNRELLRQFDQAYQLQARANRKPRHVVWRTLPIGSRRSIDMVTAMAHYGDAPETRYIPPAGSRKSRAVYRHLWGEGGGRRSVPLLAAPGGKALVMPLKGRKVVSDWMRH